MQTRLTQLALLAAVIVVVVVAAGVFRRDRPAPAAPPAEPSPLPVTPPPSPAPAPMPEAPQPAPAPRAPAADPGEVALMERLRAAVDRDPAAAVELAREGEQRFPDAADRDERSYLKMRALVNLNDIAAARDEATAFFRQNPDSPLGEAVFRLTGVQPRPRPPSER